MRSAIETGFFQHLRRLFLQGTLKNVPGCLNELFVNFREESSGIGRFCRLEFNGWPTGSVSIKKSKLGEIYETGGLCRAIHPVSIEKTKLSQLAIRWNFEPAKSANPTRFLSKIDHQLIEGARDVFQRPREKRPAKVLKNPVLSC